MQCGYEVEFTVYLVLTDPPYNVRQKLGRHASGHGLSAKMTLLKWWICAVTISNLAVTRTYSALRCNFRRGSRLFTPQLNASPSRAQIAMNKLDTKLYLIKRSKDFFTWETSIISFGTQVENVFSTSTWSRSLCTFRGQPWKWIVFF